MFTRELLLPLWSVSKDVSAFVFAIKIKDRSKPLEVNHLIPPDSGNNQEEKI
jgi:hypothetical protein